MTRDISRSKKILFYAIMLAVSSALCFILLEYGLATYYYSNEHEISKITFDPILGWRLRPGTYSIKPDHAFPKHDVYINQFGIRNRDIATVTKDDVRRVVVLGDSFTFAMKIPIDHTFPALLERFLDRTGSHEVINAGVPGYGTAQEMLLMKQLADKKLIGNVYLLMIFPNDILDNLRLSYGSLEETTAQPGFVLEENGKLRLKYFPKKEYAAHLVAPRRLGAKFVTPAVISNRIKTYLQTRPDLVNFLNDLGFEVKLPRMPGFINGWYRENILHAGIPLTKALIKEIREEAYKNQAILLASLIPSPIQLYPDVYGPILRSTFPNNKLVEDYFTDPTRPQRLIAKICDELKIPFLDLQPILLTNNDEGVFIPADGHFSKDGHAIVAEHLAGFIIKNASGNSSQRQEIDRPRSTVR